jgi:hypothetical protein
MNQTIVFFKSSAEASADVWLRMYKGRGASGDFRTPVMKMIDEKDPSRLFTSDELLFGPSSQVSSRLVRICQLFSLSGAGDWSQ